MDEDEEDNFSASISSKDVYDLAADIASEFENLAGVYGHEPLNPLVNKVICVLEHLETTVCKLEFAKNYVTDLQEQISQLQISKHANAENKIKLEQDLVDVEESWIAEIKDLKSNLSHMQDSNKHLQSLLKEQSHLEQTKESIADLHLIQELQDIVVSLNSRLKERDAMVDKHISHIALLKSDLEQQDQVNQLLHAKVNESQAQVETLWRDKTDLKIKLQKQEEMLESLQHQLESMYLSNISQHSNYGQSFSSELKDQGLSDESLSHRLAEQETLLKRIEDLEHKLAFAEKELEDCRRKADSENKVQRVQSLGSRGSAIRQLFRFFLGVVAREADNFRS